MSPAVVRALLPEQAHQLDQPEVDGGEAGERDHDGHEVVRAEQRQPAQHHGGDGAHEPPGVRLRRGRQSPGPHQQLADVEAGELGGRGQHQSARAEGDVPRPQVAEECIPHTRGCRAPEAAARELLERCLAHIERDDRQRGNDRDGDSDAYEGATPPSRDRPRRREGGERQQRQHRRQEADAPGDGQRGVDEFRVREFDYRAVERGQRFGEFGTEARQRDLDGDRGVDELQHDRVVREERAVRLAQRRLVELLERAAPEHRLHGRLDQRAAGDQAGLALLDQILDEEGGHERLHVLVVEGAYRALGEAVAVDEGLGGPERELPGEEQQRAGHEQQPGGDRPRGAAQQPQRAPRAAHDRLCCIRRIRCLARRIAPACGVAARRTIRGTALPGQAAPSAIRPAAAAAYTRSRSNG